MIFPYFPIQPPTTYDLATQGSSPATHFVVSGMASAMFMCNSWRSSMFHDDGMVGES